MRANRVKVGNTYQLFTQHLGDVLVTVTQIDAAPLPRRYQNGNESCHLGRVFCHSQNIFYPVNVLDLRAIK